MEANRVDFRVSSQSRGAYLPLKARNRVRVPIVVVWHSHLGVSEVKFMKVLTHGTRLVERDI